MPCIAVGLFSSAPALNKAGKLFSTPSRISTISLSLRRNINSAVDKEHEAKPFKEIIKLPPGALQGLKAGGPADKIFESLNIKSIEDLGKWKYFKIARAVSILADKEEANGSQSLQNINKALDKKYEHLSLKEIADAPVSALQGIAEWAGGDLGALGIKTVGDLGSYKYCLWAESLCVLADHENPDQSSR